MKATNSKASRTKFSQNLRRTLVDLAEENMKSDDSEFISKMALKRMKSSI